MTAGVEHDYIVVGGQLFRHWRPAETIIGKTMRQQ
jgi:hypothetical protein